MRTQSDTRTSFGLKATLAALAVACVPGAAAAEVTEAQGGATQLVKILRNPDPITTSSTVFVDVPGATANLKIKKDDTLVVVRYFAESSCNGGPAGNWCSLKIVAERNGVETELLPEAGLNFAFDTVEAGGDGYYTGASMERSIVLAKGKYKIKLQWATTNASTTFRLDDSSLSIETAAAPD